MKTLKNILILVLIVSAGLSAASAQTIARKSKKASREEYVKLRVDAQHFTFEANYVLPQRGGGKPLTDRYDLKVTKDSVIAFLPYFGRAYFDVPFNGADGGMKFTSTKFSYEAREKKKGGWEITIKPTDAKNVERLLVNISADGYASLSITSTNRDFITYDGLLK